MEVRNKNVIINVDKILTPEMSNIVKATSEFLSEIIEEKNMKLVYLLTFGMLDLLDKFFIVKKLEKDNEEF